MRALHVVGVDLELRLRLDLGVVAEQQVLAGLVGVGLLRVLVDVDVSGEDAGRAVVQDALVELVALAVRLSVLHPGVVVHVLRALREEEAVERAQAVFRQQRDRQVVAHQTAAEGHDIAGVAAVARLRGPERRRVERGVVLELEPRVVQLRVLLDVDELDRVGPVLTGAERRVSLDDVRARVALDPIHVARVADLAVRADEQDVEGVVQLAVDLDVGAVLEKRGVQLKERGAVGVGFELDLVPHRGQAHADRRVREVGAVVAVDEDEAAETEALDVVARHTVGAGTSQRQFAPGDRRDVGEAPLLLFRRGEAQLAEAGEAALAERVHGVAAALLRKRLERIEVVAHAGAPSSIQR